MKVSKYFFGVGSLLAGIILTACNSSKIINHGTAIAKYCIDSSLSIAVIKTNAVNVDSIIIDVELKSLCNDTMIIMKDYTKPIFYFPDGNIYSPSVQSMPTYPSIDWDKSSKGAREIFIKNRCSPSISNYNILVLVPNESKVIRYNLKQLGYSGFVSNTKYNFIISFDVSNQIKSYCPFVWAGFTKSPVYSFTIKE